MPLGDGSSPRFWRYRRIDATAVSSAPFRPVVAVPPGKPAKLEAAAIAPNVTAFCAIDGALAFTRVTP